MVRRSLIFWFGDRACGTCALVTLSRITGVSVDRLYGRSFVRRAVKYLD